MRTWLRVYDPDHDRTENRTLWPLPPPPQYYSSLLGFVNTEWLLDKDVDVNAQGEGYGNTVQAALHLGNKAMVRFLVDKGAERQPSGRRVRQRSVGRTRVRIVMKPAALQGSEPALYI